jgi:hypothetical protein
MRYLLIVAVLALVAAGCGSKSPGVANVAGTTTRGASRTGAVAFAACMRTHGVPNWPDPTSDGHFDKPTLYRLVPDATRMRVLQRPCEHLLPAFNSGSQGSAPLRIADALSFARCMRHHGVSKFPDPTAQSGLTVGLVEAQGINVHSQAFLRVVTACIPASHGGLTAAKVREAIQNHSH